MALPVVLSIIGMIMNSRKGNQQPNVAQLGTSQNIQPGMMRNLGETGQYGASMPQQGGNNTLGNVQAISNTLASLKGNNQQTQAYQMPYLRRR